MMQLACHLTAEDFQKYNTKLQKHSKLIKFVKIAVWFLVGYFASTIIQLLLPSYIFTGFDKAHGWLLVFSGLLFIFSTVMAAIWHRRKGTEAWYEKISGEYKWELNAQGVFISYDGKSNFYSWARVISVTETEDSWFVNIKSSFALVIPKRAKLIADDLCFLTEVANYWSAHPDNHGLTLQSDVLEGVKQKPFWGDLLLNIQTGAKLVFLKDINSLDFKVRTSQIAALVTIDLLTYAAFDYYQYMPDAIFNLYGLTEYAAAFLLFLITALIISHRVLSWGWLARLMVMLLASVIVVTSIYLVIDSILLKQAWYSNNSKLAWIVWSIQIAWILLAVARSLKLLYGLPKHTIVYLLAIYSTFVLAGPGFLTRQQFFIEDYREETSEKDTQRIDEEAIYYQQPEFVGNMLTQLKPERKGVVDLYFIGFAGNAYQNVFSNEVKFAKNLFDHQFDTTGRSALLINNQATINTIPLANTHNLASTIDGVAKLMNLDEDILFLFLSSHGSKSFEISTSFYPFDMNDVPANKVKEILDHSGIKNRVIVVSACYSGGFIDVLKNEDTLILTAARKDRSSFGCSNEEQYTYFGDAYFVQALKNERSFIQAFTKAQKIISAKEKKEQADSLPSLPQIFVGKSIKTKLDALTIQLANKS